MAESQPEADSEDLKKLMCSYLGLGLSMFLALAPHKFLELHLHVRDLSNRLRQAEEQVRQMRSRRKEDSKANARVVDIFASHRNAWQAEEKRLLSQIDAAEREMASLSARVEELEKTREDSESRICELEREVGERDDMIGFMASRGGGGAAEQCQQVKEVNVYDNAYAFGFDSELVAEASKLWQDVQYESLEPLYHTKQFVPRESPWKVDGESTGVSSKLKVLEQDLLNLENILKGDISKVPSLMRKQTKRYQALAGKIDDLCRRMQASDPCEATVSPEFRTQRQTEFLLESFRLQQRVTDTAQKLMAVQTEIGKSYYGDELGNQAKFMMRRSLDSIRNNFRELQRNLEIWLARITGDLEGILARDGASRVREYYVSRYPFVQ
ncbi:uncharacterized protein LOC126793226 [Argentina anserina]|uniref:uncharacterized protein LOC126793226 n=1 Tax=Argentina anserina TaxID=57926 RepID=UPI00217669A4|nr:uncharacterized protein LOC126793226 [Potentilla anserina]